MLEVSGVPLPLDAGLPGNGHLVEQAVARALGVDAGAVEEVRLLRRSVDARKGSARFIATLAVALDVPGDAFAAVKPAKGVSVREHRPYEPLDIPSMAAPADGERPVVVGSGPAGLFCALYLARAGLRPIVLERGGAIDDRLAAVRAFEEGALLDTASNIQFGEGGAGTFSDGKLTTGTKGPYPRHILQWFVEAGAPEEILWQAKPHIGTDRLVAVVRNLRNAIEDAGGTVLFDCRLDDMDLEGGHLESIVVKGEKPGALEVLERRLPEAIAASEGGAVRISCRTLVLACGHSARDTFRMLQRHRLAMEPKAFSVGVRIEHRQEAIDRAQYGRAAGHPALGPADYKLVVHLPGGRSVYTFCMCPGGEVVAAASEEFGVVVNGMSRYARDGANANAALLVSVTPDDFKSTDPLAGTVFQRRIEQAAFGEAHETGGEPWEAPVQTVGDFLAEEAGNPSTAVVPSYRRGVVWCDLREVLPPFVCDALQEALPLLDRKLKGFADPDAVMTGVETRSSSPVRILRDESTLQAYTAAPRKRVRPRDIARGHGGPAPSGPESKDIGVFPCGEGAGYAGGIMSAAADGLRVAVAIAGSQEPRDSAR